MRFERMSFSLRRGILALALAAMVWLPFAGLAASEEKDFGAASKEFLDKQYAQAEMDFSAFLNAYSNSVHLAEAALCKAEAQAMQSNYTGAINTLQAYLPHAGDHASDYIFYIAQATNALGHYQMAATGFGNVVKQFPQSPRFLEAAFGEAEAWSKLNDWARVIDLLAPTNGAFQRAARAVGSDSEFAASGDLLLARAYLELGPPADGERIVMAMPTSKLSPELTWQRAYLLCRLQLALGKAAVAETNTTNLVALARGATARALSLALRADVLMSAGKASEALDCYTNNLAQENLPESVQRESLTKALSILFQLHQTNTVVQLLEALAQRPHFPALDQVRLQLGELCLAAGAGSDTNAAALLGTNLLRRAGTNIDSVLRGFPNSPLAGRAHLDYGWHEWLATNFVAARSNFQQAVAQLPHSEDQAVARFKLGDADFAVGDYTAATNDYNALLRDYRDFPAVTNKLFDLALYKIIEASLALGDQAQASDAAAKIMAWFPTSYYGEYGGMLLGEDLLRKNDYSLARHEFSELLKKPGPLAPQAEFAIARTYGLEGDWTNALAHYDQWVTNHPQSDLLPRVEFERALAYDKSGRESNALELMTNFVARFATNNLAPWAQNWIADYYFNLSDFPKAEINYEELYDKWPNAEGDLAYRARFMAGRAALGRQDPGEARGYFTNLINLPNTPPAILRETYYALADAIYLQDPTNTVALSQAIAALSKLTNGAATNATAALAFGRLGDFYSQGKDYAGAKQMYGALLSFSNVIDNATRCQAEIGLGYAALALQQTNEALQHFNAVLYHSDPPDPSWIREAGVAAAPILEARQQWEAARNVYQRVLGAAPALRPMLQHKIDYDQQNVDAAQKTQ